MYSESVLWVAIVGGHGGWHHGQAMTPIWSNRLVGVVWQVLHGPRDLQISSSVLKLATALLCTVHG